MLFFYNHHFFGLASKRTMHLLKLLLNFYHYYNMIKVQVEEESNDVVRCYETAHAERNKCLHENQIAKDKADRVNNRIFNLNMFMESMIVHIR